MMLSPQKTDITTVGRAILAIAVTVAGLAIFAFGLYLEFLNPKTNAEDDMAWLALAFGTSMTAAGCTIPFLRIRQVALVAVAAPPLAFAGAFLVVWTVIILTLL